MYLNSSRAGWLALVTLALLAFALGLDSAYGGEPIKEEQIRETWRKSRLKKVTPAWEREGFAEEPICKPDEDGKRVEWTPWCGCLPPLLGSDC